MRDFDPADARIGSRATRPGRRPLANVVRSPAEAAVNSSGFCLRREAQAAITTDESLCRTRFEMCEKQRRDLVRNLLGSKMSNAGQHFELIWRSNKFCRARGRRAANRIIGIAPNEQGGHFYDT